jgi:hypothetical protein
VNSFQFEVFAQPVFLELGETLEIIKAFKAAGHGGQRDEEHLSEIVSFGSSIAGIGESFERFHARRKSPGVLLIASLLVGHPAPLIQTIVSYKA